MYSLILTLFISYSALAQHSEQPQKESVSDLRSADVLFSVEEVGKEKTYWLERTSNLDHFLRIKDEGKEEVIKKVDGRVAKKIDMDFASRFLRCQYEYPDSPGECKVTLRLMLKGEKQEICLKDEKKSREIQGFIEDLNKRYK